MHYLVSFDPLLRSYVSDKVDVVVQMPRQLVPRLRRGLPNVTDELALGHLVLDVRTRQVHRKNEQ